MRVMYSLLMWLATPLVLGYFALRSLRDARWRRGWSQRLGLDDAAPARLVVHCASVGEVTAAAPLVNALLERPGTSPVTLTTITPTGAERARELFGEQVSVRYLPLDLPGATRRFLAHSKPGVLVIVETEIWPNLVRAAGRAAIPVLLVNARLSERSLHGYRRIAPLVHDAFAGLAAVLAQTPGDGERFATCGVPADRIRVIGNLKFDAPPPAGIDEAGVTLRAAWGDSRPVLVAGSTREGEEALLIAGFPEVLESHPGALLVIAPRHPERFERVAEMLHDAGLGFARHSRREVPGTDQPVLLLDALGALMSHYAAADLAFVGGTLVPVGGHNLLEPAALGKPVLFGPHLANVRDIADSLLAAGAALEVADGSTLAEAVKGLFADPTRRSRMGEAGKKLVAEGQGALLRALAAIETVFSRN